MKLPKEFMKSIKFINFGKQMENKNVRNYLDEFFSYKEHTMDRIRNVNYAASQYFAYLESEYFAWKGSQKPVIVYDEANGPNSSICMSPTSKSVATSQIVIPKSPEKSLNSSILHQ